MGIKAEEALALAQAYASDQIKKVESGGVSESFLQEQITNNPTVASKVTMDEVNTQVNELLTEKNIDNKADLDKLLECGIILLNHIEETIKTDTITYDDFSSGGYNGSGGTVSWAYKVVGNCENAIHIKSRTYSSTSLADICFFDKNGDFISTYSDENKTSSSAWHDFECDVPSNAYSYAISSTSNSAYKSCTTYIQYSVPEHDEYVLSDKVATKAQVDEVKKTSVIDISQISGLPTTKFVYSDGKFLYTLGYNKFKKFDLLYESVPTLVKELSLVGIVPAGQIVSGYDVKDGYLYVTIRDWHGGLTNIDGTTVVCALVVVKMSDMSLVNTINMYKKGGGVYINGNTMFVPCQLKGYQIYDISDLENPTLLLDYDPTTEEEDNTWEWQGAQWFENDEDKLCIAVANYYMGASIYDMTDVTNPVLLENYNVKLDYPSHTVFDVVVDYPNIYLPISLAHNGGNKTSKDHTGILKCTIGDMANDHTLMEITKDDLPPVGTGDPAPTYLQKKGNYLISNLDSFGFAFFDLKEDKYLNRISVTDNDDASIECMNVYCDNYNRLWLMLGSSVRMVKIVR